jgi:hypothetical protein
MAQLSALSFCTIPGACRKLAYMFSEDATVKERERLNAALLHQRCQAMLSGE